MTSPKDEIPVALRPAPGRVGVGNNQPNVINIRCPYCRHNGSFGGFAGDRHHDITWQQHWGLVTEGKSPGPRSTAAQAGLRCCPNPKCDGLVFVIQSGGALLRSFPSETKEFDPAGIPEEVARCMSEAIECHAQGCYRAAALMVRRALEELCEDRGAKGATLEARIEALSASIVIPKGLIDGAHELRFLGNDAAHIVAKQYKNIGREETDLAIDVALTLLRATYQTVDLIARLKARKGSNPSPA